MVICSTVAKDTHSRYGIIMYITHLLYGYIAIIAQISVVSTSKMSRLARGRLRRPNCIGVKARLKTILRIKGSATINGILSCDDPGKKVLINTLPNDMIIMA
jgi:hypothetical protein